MFKKNLEEICAKKGVSPTSVCVGVGLSNATYSQWTDESVPRKTTLIKIADYLGVTVEDLLREDGEAPPPVDPIDAEIAELWGKLTEEQQADVMQYIEFLRAKNGK